MRQAMPAPGAATLENILSVFRLHAHPKSVGGLLVAVIWLVRALHLESLKKLTAYDTRRGFSLSTVFGSYARGFVPGGLPTRGVRGEMGGDSSLQFVPARPVWGLREVTRKTVFWEMLRKLRR